MILQELLQRCRQCSRRFSARGAAKGKAATARWPMPHDSTRQTSGVHELSASVRRRQAGHDRQAFACGRGGGGKTGNLGQLADRGHAVPISVTPRSPRWPRATRRQTMSMKWRAGRWRRVPPRPRSITRDDSSRLSSRSRAWREVGTEGGGARQGKGLSGSGANHRPVKQMATISHGR